MLRLLVVLAIFARIILFPESPSLIFLILSHEREFRPVALFYEYQHDLGIYLDLSCKYRAGMTILFRD